MSKFCITDAGCLKVDAAGCFILCDGENCIQVCVDMLIDSSICDGEENGLNPIKDYCGFGSDGQLWVAFNGTQIKFLIRCPAQADVEIGSVNVIFDMATHRGSIIYTVPLGVTYFIPYSYHAPAADPVPSDMGCCQLSKDGAENSIPFALLIPDSYSEDFATGPSPSENWNIISSGGTLTQQPDIRLDHPGGIQNTLELDADFRGIYVYDQGTTDNFDPNDNTTWPDVSWEMEMEVSYGPDPWVPFPNETNIVLFDNYFGIEFTSPGSYDIKEYPSDAIIGGDPANSPPTTMVLKVEEDLTPDALSTDLYQRVERYYLDGVLIHTRDDPARYRDKTFACFPRVDLEMGWRFSVAAANGAHFVSLNSMSMQISH